MHEFLVRYSCCLEPIRSINIQVYLKVDTTTSVFRDTYTKFEFSQPTFKPTFEIHITIKLTNKKGNSSRQKVQCQELF